MLQNGWSAIASWRWTLCVDTFGKVNSCSLSDELTTGIGAVLRWTSMVSRAAGEENGIGGGRRWTGDLPGIKRGVSECGDEQGQGAPFPCGRGWWNREAFVLGEGWQFIGFEWTQHASSHDDLSGFVGASEQIVECVTMGWRRIGKTIDEVEFELTKELRWSVLEDFSCKGWFGRSSTWLRRLLFAVDCGQWQWLDGDFDVDACWADCDEAEEDDSDTAVVAEAGPLEDEREG